MDIKVYKQLPIPSDTVWERFTIRRYLPYWFKCFIDGIKNIFIWVPILYKDKNWDQWYIYEILKFKLIQQREYLVKHNRHTLIWRDNRDITICLNLIERCQEDYYDFEHRDYKKDEFKWIPTENPDLSKLEIEHILDNLDKYFKKYPNSYRIILNSEREKKRWTHWDKHTQAMSLGDYQQQKCQRLLFKILNERINFWWD